MNNASQMILVVDDEEIVRKLLADYLVALGHRVDRAENGEAALAALGACSYDRAFVDIHMSGIDGYELMERIRESWPQLRVCLMAGFPAPDLAERSFGLGAASTLAKPFKLVEIDQFLEDTPAIVLI